MRNVILAMATVACLHPVVARADVDLAAELKQDVLLRALVDELERGQGGLKLADLERPYFLEYALQDVVVASVSAKLGAVTSHNTSRNRSLRTDIRVGSYALDNTNFAGGSSGFMLGGGFDEAAVPLEDDYDGIRQAIWWATDRQYKEAIETFEKKKAFMETKLIEDKPEDFSRESSTVHFDEKEQAEVDLARLESIAVALSAVFREFPDIQDSAVNVGGGGGNEYLVNTEGTRLRTSGLRLTITVIMVQATAQAADGMKLSDSFSVYAKKFAELPSLESLQARCRGMADRLIQVSRAPTLDSYTGPVLFEAEAAAPLFMRNFARRFAGGQRDVGARANPDDFEKKLGQRILPRFLNVVDDPTQETIAGQIVMGQYEYDDQGVPVRPVTVVEEGRLKALLMSRNPSKEFKSSTGHGRGTYGPQASPGCLIVTASEGDDADSLRQQLLEACAEEGLEFGVRIAALGSVEGGGSFAGRRRFGASSGDGATPLVIYKVFPDGHEELVRGAQLAAVSLKAFKRMLAAGDAPYVLNTATRGGGTTLVAPALLFEELDLTGIDQDFDKPPILPNPLARE